MVENSGPFTEKSTHRPGITFEMKITDYLIIMAPFSGTRNQMHRAEESKCHNGVPKDFSVYFIVTAKDKLLIFVTSCANQRTTESPESMLSRKSHSDLDANNHRNSLYQVVSKPFETNGCNCCYSDGFNSERSGRPLANSTPENVKTIRQLVHDDRRRTIHVISLPHPHYTPDSRRLRPRPEDEVRSDTTSEIQPESQKVLDTLRK
ncbi:hypothetical protein C0J45_17761 [Silurus meridionalis]|nr:hypothetical protein C0J45_17761 [Silurus meridionalis]